jgi:hypothetical protein
MVKAIFFGNQDSSATAQCFKTALTSQTYKKFSGSGNTLNNIEVANDEHSQGYGLGRLRTT